MAEKFKKRKSDQGLKEKDIKKLIHLLDKIKHGIELLYYLLDNRRQDSFVVALFSASLDDFETVIRHEKRETDVLLEIDAPQNLYAILCQGTSIDGGYYFMNRMVGKLREKGARNIYCSEIEISGTNHSIEEVVFRLLNMYQRIKAEKADGEISFHSLR